MAAGGHFGCQKITFDRISGHFRSIRNFFFKKFFKMATAPILDVRNSLSIEFLPISDRYTTLIFEMVRNAIKSEFGHPKWPIDLKWPVMRSKMTWKIIILYRSEMARFAIENEFRTSKMADRSEMARNAIESEIRTRPQSWKFQSDQFRFENHYAEKE